MLEFKKIQKGALTMDVMVLQYFLSDLTISAEHQSVIFDTLSKIEKNDEAKKLFFSFYTPYKEKGELDYNTFYKENLPKLWELLPDIHKYTINLAVLFALAPYSERYYYDTGVSREVWINSMLDFKWKLLDCIDINGFAGIRSSSLAWFDRWFFGKRFAFHRLQFEINPSTRDYKSENFDIKTGDKLISVHIPSARNGIKFDKENRDISYAQAREYYSEQLGTEKPVFSCNSWLLAPLHSEALPESSNIRQFKEEFEIVSSGPSTWQLPMIFNTENIADTENLPEETSMQKLYKKVLLEGKSPEGALGYRY